jgi:uncharacterized protein YkwD
MILFESLRTLSLRPTSSIRLILVAISLLAPGLMSGVSAQVVSRPVARLISSNSDEIDYSRSRRSTTHLSDVRTSETATSVASSSINQATKAERQAFEATNDVRAKNGFAPLSWNNDLSRMARAHSENMARLGFFAHETPEGLRLRDRAREARIRFQVIGENIAYNQGVDDPGTFAVQRWMASSGHRANILSGEFQASGVGSFTDRDGKVYLTQIFIAP